MLLLPKQRIRRYQIILFVVLTTTLSSMFLIVSFPSVIQNIRESSFSTLEQEEDYKFAADSPVALDFIEITSSLIFLIGLLVLTGLLFLWVPSLTDLTESKGKMIWLRKGLFFPERVLSFSEEDTKIIISRKRTSIHGLFFREFTIQILLPKDKSNLKQIIDFSGIEKIVHTPAHNILLKTVKSGHIPLQIIQIRSILSLMKQSSENLNSSG